MTPLTFTLKNKPEFTLDVSVLTPDKLAKKNRTQIKSLKLDYGTKKVAVADLFSITGNDPNNIEIHKSSDRVICVGKGISHGTIEVKGNVGDLLGQHMKGGHIKINGNTGSWTGNGMSGGRIDITGNAGHHVGAGKPGDAFGMNEGFINIKGSAGDRVGDRMRRGIITIHGKAGDYCGSRMHAGTILVLDKAGKNVGTGMRRGTIILSKKPKHIVATFKSNGNLKMQFLRLLFTQFVAMGKEFAKFKNFDPEVHRFSGDLARNGKGEILILQSLDLRR